MIKHITDNVTQLSFKEFGSTVFILKLPEPILIDTSSREAKNELIADLKKLNIEPSDIKSIILTHAHWDHDGNLDLFTNAKVYSATNLEELKAAFPDFKIYETPGHTRDSICLLYEDILFSGDTIFDKDHIYIGRTDLPESVPKQMQKSLELVKSIPYKILCPGHLV